jgi:hypothetical protein
LLLTYQKENDSSLAVEATVEIARRQYYLAGGDRDVQ